MRRYAPASALTLVIHDRGAGPSIGEAVGRLVRHPVRCLIRRWNWKSAVLSSLVRSGIFLAANAGAGASAAWSAFLTELVFRAGTAGFYGAMTQAFRDVEPPWTGTLAAVVILPLTAHTLEFFVHWERGTARLAASMAASVGFTVISTAYNLYAMRQGALIVGEGSESIWRDLGRTPRLIAAFVVSLARGRARLV